MKKRIVVGLLVLSIMAFFAACSTSEKVIPTSYLGAVQNEVEAPDSVSPGLIEDKTNPQMAKINQAHEALSPISDDEIIVYYYREDAHYDEWGIWAWAFPDGDGAANWDFTQNLEVTDGVGYLRLKKGRGTGGLSIGDSGVVGLIPRQDADWIKDGDNDRLFDTNISNEIVIFSGDQETYPLGSYTPSFKTATFVTPTTIKVVLSGHHGLSLEPSNNGFVIQNAEGSLRYEIADVVNFNSKNDRSKNNADVILITLAEPAEVGLPVQIFHNEYLAPADISFASLIIATADSIVPSADLKLGAIYDKGSVEFRLWTPFAENVSVNLYKVSNSNTPVYSFPLTKNAENGVWSGNFDQEDPDGFFYEYMVTTSRGTRPVLDPYASSMDAFLGSGSGRAAIIDPAKALPAGGWEGYTDYDLAQREDAIIYEVSVRDFTISPDAGIQGEAGTYLGFIEKLPYLKSLGITHIQLMPVLNFYYTNEADRNYEADGTASNNNYNWGYDPHSYFTPEGWYSSNARDPYSRVVELKTLIKEIHKAGMGVLLDVVYNHLGNATILEDIFPGYFFRYNQDGSMQSKSGCGNDVATTHAMASRLIVDSMAYWTEEYKVDGFRFDLMGLIDSQTMLNGYDACSSIPEKSDILFEGEGWKMYNGPAGTVGLDQSFMNRTDSIAVFNDEVRDILKAGGMSEEGKGLLTGRRSAIDRVFSNLMGQPQSNYSADDPGDSIVYTTCHDGLTLHDAISHNMGLNDSREADKLEIAARTELGNFLVLTSQGIAFLHAGQERGRTKPALNATSETLGRFVRNSYDSSDNINQIIWNLDPVNQELLDYTSGLVAIRNEYDAFRIGTQDGVNASVRLLETDSRLGMSWIIDYRGDSFLMVVNADKGNDLSLDTGLNLTGGSVLVDSDEASLSGVLNPSGFSINDTQISIEPLTALMIKL